MNVNEPWKAFADAAPWWVQNHPHARPIRTRPSGSWVPSSPEFTSLFPVLADLLARATLTEIAFRSESWILFSWDTGRPESRGWLSPGSRSVPSSVHPHHRVLLRSFNGIVEVFGHVESRVTNQRELLTPTLAERDATFIRAYEWAFEETGGNPVDLEAYYVVAEEANGNATVCHRVDGDVLLFAPDHAFDDVRVLDGCPELTFYRIPGAHTIAQWINHIAEQWQAPTLGAA